MKTIKYLLLWSVLLVSAIAQQQSAESHVSIVVMPYTITEVNYDKSLWTFTEHGAVIDQIEISVRNNTQNITSLSTRVQQLFDSTEVKIRLFPNGNNTVIIYGEQFVDVNPSVFVRNIVGSQKFMATYTIITKQYQSVEEIMRAVVWTLEVTP
jgi:hypothetical protein